MALLHTGTNVFRTITAIEAVLSIMGGVGQLRDPQSQLQMMVRNSADVNSPIAQGLVQGLGVSSMLIAVPLVLGYSNTAFGVANRYIAQYLLGTFEAGIIGLFTWHTVAGYEAFDEGFMKATMAIFGTVLSLRILTLTFRPQWIGIIKEEGIKRK